MEILLDMIDSPRKRGTYINDMVRGLRKTRRALLYKLLDGADDFVLNEVAQILNEHKKELVLRGDIFLSLLEEVQHI